AGTGKYAFVTDMPKAQSQKAQQFDLQVPVRGKVGMAAFAREDKMAASIPKQSGFAESGTGGDYGLIASNRAAALVQHDQIAFRQRADAPGAGLEIVDQKRGRKMNLLRKSRLFDDPGQVRCLDAAI